MIDFRVVMVDQGDVSSQMVCAWSLYFSYFIYILRMGSEDTIQFIIAKTTEGTLKIDSINPGVLTGFARKKIGKSIITSMGLASKYISLNFK